MSLTFIDLETFTMQTAEKLLGLNKNWRRWSWACWSPAGRCEGWWAQWAPGGRGAARTRPSRQGGLCCTMCNKKVLYNVHDGGSQVEIRRWEGNLTCADLINVNHWLPLNSTAMACLLSTLSYKKWKRCLLPKQCVCFIHMYSLFQSGLYKLWNPAISDGRPWSKFGKHREQGNWRTWKR